MAPRYHFEGTHSGWTAALGLAVLVLLAFPAAAYPLQTGNTPAKPSPTPAATQQISEPAGSTASPVPPAQQSAHPAKIDVSHGNITIQADNSSLVAILNQISQQTGMTIQGLGHDQRIYGKYGPGLISNVLAQLLDGSGYNYVILNQGPGNTPAKLLLTNAGSGPSSPGPAPAVASNSTPPAAAAPANPSAPVHPKTPQQIFQELRRMHPRR